MDIGENIFTRRAAPLCFCQGSWSSSSVSSLLTISPFTVFLPVVFPHDWAEPPLVLLAEPPPVPQALLGLLTLSSVQDLHSAQGGLIHLAQFSPSFPKAHIFGQSSSSGVVTREGSQKDSAPMGHWGHWDTTPDMDVHPGVSLVPVEAALMGPTQPSPEVDPGAPQCSGGHSWERNMSQLSPKSTGWSEMADGTMGGAQQGTQTTVVLGTVVTLPGQQPSRVLGTARGHAVPFQKLLGGTFCSSLLHTQSCPEPHSRDTAGCSSR